MKVCSVIAVVASAILSVSSAHARDDAQEPFQFSVGGKGFAMPVPAGYCVPEGPDARMAEQIAAGDSQNETVAEFHRCGSFGQDYIIVKAAYATRSLTFDKPAFLEQFTNFWQSEMGKNAQDQGMSIAQRDMQNATNGSMSLAESPYGYSKTDSDCVYMSGIINLQAMGAMIGIPVGSCISVAGTKQIAVHHYVAGGEGGLVPALEERSRELFLSINAL